MADEEWCQLDEAATRQGLTLSAWVRRVLDDARRAQPAGDLAAKLRAVRAATAHDFPTADVDQMLAEVERGYRASSALPA